MRPSVKPLPTALSYLGQLLPLIRCHTDTANLSLTKEANRFLLFAPPSASSDTLRCLIADWYRRKARRILTQRTAYYAKRMELTYERIAIREQKTRWGSCSSKKNLNYNWHIIELLPACIDYLVIHELCHLSHFDHSEAFWQMVARYDPDYRKHRRQLQDYSREVLQKI